MQVTKINVWNSYPEQITNLFKGIPLVVEAVWAQGLRAYMITINLEDRQKVFEIMETIDPESVIVCEVYQDMQKSDEAPISSQIIKSTWEVS